MKLYFNGCSHTAGLELEHPESDAWPVLVAEHYHKSFFNDAMQGSTNDRIVHRTLQHINDYDKFYIAWTNTARFSRFMSDKHQEVYFRPNLEHRKFIGQERYSKYGEIHYTEWFNELFNFKSWLHQIILLQKTFESKNLPYTMISGYKNDADAFTGPEDKFKESCESILNYSLSDEQAITEYKEIQTLLGEINFNNFIGWDGKQIDWCMYRFECAFKVGDGGHYLEEGHRAIADYIIKRAST